MDGNTFDFHPHGHGKGKDIVQHYPHRTEESCSPQMFFALTLQSGIVLIEMDGFFFFLKG